jgi:hypothetical protein
MALVPVAVQIATTMAKAAAKEIPVMDHNSIG